MPLAIVAVAAGALPAATSAGQRQPGCVAPNVVGVDLSIARHTLASSGCSLDARQLPGHGEFVAPASPDGRQIVASQRPRPGSRTGQVVLSLKPLCAQPAAPGPDTRGPASRNGPTELVAGMFLQGGPVRTAPSCRHGSSSPGTLTVSAADGRVVAHRAIRAGHFGVFPLMPGRYTIVGALSGTFGATPAQSLTIVAHRTTRLNLVANVG